MAAFSARTSACRAFDRGAFIEREPVRMLSGRRFPELRFFDIRFPERLGGFDRTWECGTFERFMLAEY